MWNKPVHEIEVMLVNSRTQKNISGTFECEEGDEDGYSFNPENDLPSDPEDHDDDHCYIDGSSFIANHVRFETEDFAKLGIEHPDTDLEISSDEEEIEDDETDEDGFVKYKTPADLPDTIEMYVRKIYK